MGRNLRTLLLIGLVGSLMIPSTQAGAAAGPVTLTVDALAHIDGAGHAIPPDPGGGGGGELPPVYEFSVGPGAVLRVSSVPGLISADNGATFNRADGSKGSIT